MVPSLFDVGSMQLSARKVTTELCLEIFETDLDIGVTLLSNNYISLKNKYW